MIPELLMRQSGHPYDVLLVNQAHQLVVDLASRIQAVRRTSWIHSLDLLQVCCAARTYLALRITLVL